VEILPREFILTGLMVGPRPGNMSQNATSLMMLFTKKTKPKTKEFFALQTRRLAKSLAQLMKELRCC